MPTPNYKKSLQPIGTYIPAENKTAVFHIEGLNAQEKIILGSAYGNLASCLLQMHRYEEAEDALETQMMRIEPTMVVITSVLVGVILLTVMFPLVNIMKTIG